MSLTSSVNRTARWLQPVSDLVFPPTCAFCSRMIPGPHDSMSPLLCRRCHGRFHDEREACLHCGLPVGPFVDNTDRCIRCRPRRFRFRRVIRLGVYQEALREACIRGKTIGTESLSAALARLLIERERRALEETEADLIVPVPQHWCHRLTRPHHQANTIAGVIGRCLNLPVDEHLVRKRRLTRDQSSLPRTERQQNLTKVFNARRGVDLNGKRILLVDDILTTGTTANEVSRALGQAGAKSVTVAVLAVVP